MKYRKIFFSKIHYFEKIIESTRHIHNKIGFKTRKTKLMKDKLSRTFY